MFSKLVLGAIWGYQQYLSPQKGFRCAYSLRHGGTGCSGYAKHAIKDAGIWRALPSIRQRLRDCRIAHQDIRENCTCNEAPLDDDERAELEHHRRKGGCADKYDCSFACCDCSSLGWFRGPASSGSSNGCDISPCNGDCGAPDCAACDCGGCDCGGCSCG